MDLAAEKETRFGGEGRAREEETFDDLMNTRDDTFELMDNDFDDAFFGLDSQNN